MKKAISLTSWEVIRSILFISILFTIMAGIIITGDYLLTAYQDATIKKYAEQGMIYPLKTSFVINGIFILLYLAISLLFIQAIVNRKYLFERLKKRYDDRKKRIREPAAGLLKADKRSRFDVIKPKRPEKTTGVIERRVSAYEQKLKDMERQLMEVTQKLKTTEMNYRILYGSSRDAIIILTPEGKIIRWNPAAVKMFGCIASEKSVLKPLVDLSPEYQPDGSLSLIKAEKLIERVMKKGAYFYEWKHKRADGNEFFASVLLTRIKSQGKVVLQAAIRDISGVKKMEKFQRLMCLGEVVSNIAHEVNNPLQVISGNAQLCLTEKIKNEDLKKSIKTIWNQTLQAKDIIQRILIFAKPGTGELKDLDINEALNSAVELVERQFTINNIKIIENYDSSLPDIKADEKQIYQVFMNLLKNASEAMPEGGSIYVSTYEKDKIICVEISDTGTGMPEDIIKRIFDPFFTTKEKGTGLGLSVCYGIIKSHGGELCYDSKPGKGTKARIFFPIGKNVKVRCL